MVPHLNVNIHIQILELLSLSLSAYVHANPIYMFILNIESILNN